MLSWLQYPPVLRGLFAILLAGILLPQGGMVVLRLNLIPLRFMLIHGILLGGSIGLAIGVSPTLSSLIINLMMVLAMVAMTRTFKGDLGHWGILIMSFSAALASFIIYRFNVPAKDTMALLWGSPFTVKWGECILFGGMTLGFILLRILVHRSLTTVFFDRELAGTMGIPVNLYLWILVMILAVMVSMAMKLLGALLMDILLLLPALSASWMSRSFKTASWLASLLGVAIGLSGFILALLWDLPVSSAMLIPTALLLLIAFVKQRSAVAKA